MLIALKQRLLPWLEENRIGVLLVLVLALNLAAILIRNRLRKKFAAVSF